MITVRFSNGTSIQYSQGTNVSVDEHGNMTVITKENHWVAKIPAGASCVIEGGSPCRIYNALSNVEQARSVIENMRNLSYSDSRVLIEMKRKLTNFNATTRTWKDS